MGSMENVHFSCPTGASVWITDVHQPDPMFPFGQIWNEYFNYWDISW